ncbi:hypothetical protein E3T54_12670 [Cryobacterium sp. Sr8]|uniref:hypothetical protein n=1 Tax=Cryobacterium sp. Sr8 TaxID=1259203 RepID=UPI001068EA40|nr:hypothetical protein [Cryobacterium sp. Sr8]TFD75163.1 hypothetical protein E3T54_12670 [Cryobacterium sp. Sr8]
MIDMLRSSQLAKTPAAVSVAVILAAVVSLFLGLHTLHGQGDDAPGTSHTSASAGPLDSESLASVAGETTQTSCPDCQIHCPDGESTVSCAPASTPALMMPSLPRQNEPNDLGRIDDAAGEARPVFASQKTHPVSRVELSVSRV